MGSVMSMYVFDQFHSASNSAFLFSCTELALFVELDGDHHAVAHALGARVIVRPIGDVSQRAVLVGSGLEVDSLFLTITVKELLKSFLDLRA